MIICELQSAFVDQIELNEGEIQANSGDRGSARIISGIPY